MPKILLRFRDSSAAETFAHAEIVGIECKGLTEDGKEAVLEFDANVPPEHQLAFEVLMYHLSELGSLERGN